MFQYMTLTHACRVALPHLCDEVLRLPQEAVDGLHTLALGKVPVASAASAASASAAASAAAAAMALSSCMTDATRATSILQMSLPQLGVASCTLLPLLPLLLLQVACNLQQHKSQQMPHAVCSSYVLQDAYQLHIVNLSVSPNCSGAL
jgi:hypothetical protein